MLSRDQSSFKKCGLFKSKCGRCITSMVFNHPRFLPLSPIICKCDNINSKGHFEVSKFRQFVALFFTAALIAITVMYLYRLQLMCEQNTTVCLQALTQILYSILSVIILIYGHVKPKITIQLLEEWSEIVRNNTFVCTHNDLLIRNVVYLTTLLAAPLATGFISYMFLRDQTNVEVRCVCLVLSLQLQLAGMFRHAMIMTFLQKVYQSFGLEIKSVLEERDKKGSDQNRQSTTESRFEESFLYFRKYYVSLTSNTLLITKNNSEKLFAWLVSVIIILGINIYNLVLACSNGFSVPSDLVIPFETYGLISLILHIIKCVQQLSDVVSNIFPFLLN